jgi:hypothetical protein
MSEIPMNKDVKFSPEDIAAILGQYPPTPEQAKIIASPNDRPAVATENSLCRTCGVIASCPIKNEGRSLFS